MLDILNAESKLALLLLKQAEKLLEEATKKYQEPSDLVEYCTPRLHDLLSQDPRAVQALVSLLEWPEQDSETYTRRRLLEADNGSWSIYAICWQPGQYTPIHDHGTWGVVGVLEGTLFEHQFACTYKDDATGQYQLVPAGVTLLSQGAVNTFIPEPDHIHKSGVPKDRAPTASLHLYGRVMTHYHAYDQESGTRTRLDVE